MLVDALQTVVQLHVVVVPEVAVNHVHQDVDKVIVVEDVKQVVRLNVLMDVLVVIHHVLVHVMDAVERVVDVAVAEGNVKMLLIVVVAVHQLIKRVQTVKLHVVLHAALLAKMNLLNHVHRAEQYAKEPYLRLRLRQVVIIKNKEGE